MYTLRKLKFLCFFLLNFNSSYITCQSQNTSTVSCGKIQIQTPFFSRNATFSSPLHHMILCRSNKLYFRTSAGLFSVSSIDYTSKTLTISNPSCSSSRHYVSPSVLSAGFPSPPNPNSVLLFGCSNKNYTFSSSLAQNCSALNPCAASSKTETGLSHSCLVVEDVEKLEKGFHPKDLRCSHYSQVHRMSSSSERYELGTRISFDIPDHAPEICNECEKSNGNCGVGLRCICHPQQCRDRVISMAGSQKNHGNTLLSMLILIALLIELMNCC